MRAFLRINPVFMDQPTNLERRSSSSSHSPDNLQGLAKTNNYNVTVRSYFHKVLSSGVQITDNFFVPYEFQTMAFGDLVWSHQVPAVVETFHNAASLLSEYQSLIEAYSLNQKRLQFRIIYTLSTKYAAECFGDIRVRDLWHDLPVIADITLGDATASQQKFEATIKSVKAVYDANTVDSLHEMIKRGYIAHRVPPEKMDTWITAKDEWYANVFVPGREAMFEAWLADVAPYHAMLVRVLNCMWRCPRAERVARREMLVLRRLNGLGLDPDDLKGHIGAVGLLLDGFERSDMV